jgi:hypothetical protein
MRDGIAAWSRARGDRRQERERPPTPRGPLASDDSLQDELIAIRQHASRVDEGAAQVTQWLGRGRRFGIALLLLFAFLWWLFSPPSGQAPRRTHAKVPAPATT